METRLHCYGVKQIDTKKHSVRLLRPRDMLLITYREVSFLPMELESARTG